MQGLIVDNFYIADIFRYIKHEDLPLWVEYVERGGHIERLFHDHEFSEIAIVLHGSAIHLADERAEKISAGDVLLLHPGASHAYDKTGDMELINIVYDWKKLAIPFLDGYSLPMFYTFFPVAGKSAKWNYAAPVMTLSLDEMAEVLQMIKRLENELKNFKPGTFFLSLAMFMEIVVMLARHDAIKTSKHQFRFQIGETLEYINRNYRRNIEVNELVAVSKMSRRNLFRKFKESTGYTPIEYLLQIRLQRAMELLRSSSMNVNEIAEECGFCDSNYLCKLFRKHLNISPRMFRLSNSSQKHNQNIPDQAV
jgi:AraC-like DNA-binding protein